MIPLIVALNVISALLPLVAIFRLLRRAAGDREARQQQIAERGSESWNLGDITRMMQKLTLEPFERFRALLWDVGLIGTGVAIGAAANIWSLFA